MDINNSGQIIGMGVKDGVVQGYLMTPSAGGGSGMEEVYWHHNDHLGTPQALTDANGTVVWMASYTPFGIATVNEDPDGDGITVTNNFRFPGQSFDAETGLNYNYQRTYDPAIGRYTQHDPIGLNGGMNPFGYVGGNPVNLIDITGLRSRVSCVLVPVVGLLGARHCYIESEVDGVRTTWGLIGNFGGLSRTGKIYINNGFDLDSVVTSYGL